MIPRSMGVGVPEVVVETHGFQWFHRFLGFYGYKNDPATNIQHSQRHIAGVMLPSLPSQVLVEGTLRIGAGVGAWTR